MPWTGGAFLVGAMAIAGLPPLNGFASEWLTLQSLLAVPGNGGVAEGLAGAIALGALAATAALAVLCFVKVVGLVLLGAPRRRRVAEAVDAPFPMRLAVGALALACVVLGVIPGVLAGPLAGLAPWPSDDTPSAAVDVPWNDALPAPGIASCCSSASALLFAHAGQADGQRRADVGLRASRRAASLPGRARGSRSRCGSCSRSCCVLSGRSPPRAQGGVLQEVRYEGHVPHLFDSHALPPAYTAWPWPPHVMPGVSRAEA